LSRRLGEDPLTRARKKRGMATKAALTSTSETVGETSAAEAALLAPSRSSFNDVFFQRKSPESEGSATVKTGSLSGQADDDAHQPSPEISEISEIPEIRELATAPAATTSTAADASPSLAITEVARPSIPIADSTHRTEEHQDAAGVHGVDEITTAPEAEPVPTQIVQLETHTDAIKEAVVAPNEAKPQGASSIVSAVTPPSNEPEKAQPAPQKSGFFKKLFGRFGSK
jgi:hypothetical protein